MERVSTTGRQADISRYNIYDFIVLLYVCSFFVFENAKYAQVFNIIQILFLGASAFVAFKKRIIRRSAAHIWTIALLIVASILALGYRTTQVWTTLATLFRNAVKIWLFTLYLKERKSFQRLIGFLSIGGLISGFFLISEFFSADLVYTDLKYATISRIGADIAGGNVNIVSMNMCISFCATMYLIDEACERRWKIIYALCAVFIVGTSLLTGSRKVLVFYVLVFVLFNISRGPRFILYFLAVAILGYLALMYIEPLYFLIGHKVDFFRESTAYTMYNGTNSDRLSLAIRGLNTFLSYPWGIGFGNSYNYIGTYAHNNFVEILMDGGIFGFLVYYWLYFRGIRLGYKERYSDMISKFVYISLLGIMILEVGQVTYLYSVPMVFFSVVLNMDYLQEQSL